MKTLLKNAAIIGLKDGKVIKNGSIGIEDDTIISVCEHLPDDMYDVIKDMKNKVLMPGFINGHTHSPMSLLRGVGSNLPLDRWLNEAIFPVEKKLTNELVAVGTRISIMEMLAGGVTSFSDMYEFSEAIIQEAVDAKIKANICSPIFGFDPEEKYENSVYVRKSLALYNDFNGISNSKILIDFGVHAEYTCTDNLARNYAQDLMDKKANVHIHLSETIKEHNECKVRNGKTPTEWFNEMGIFNSNCQAAHCVVLEDKDLEIIKDKGVSIVHNPTSNMKLGSGFARLNSMINMGINVTVGTDGSASNNNQNMLEEMHLAALIHKGNLQDPTIIEPRQIFDMATKNGAKMQGRANTGIIGVGKKADIIAIDFDKPHLMPNFDTFSNLLYSAQASDVYMTMVDGEILYENGVFLTIDAEKAKYDLHNAVNELY